MVVSGRSPDSQAHAADLSRAGESPSRVVHAVAMDSPETLAYRCGGSAGIGSNLDLLAAPASRFTRCASRAAEHLTTRSGYGISAAATMPERVPFAIEPLTTRERDGVLSASMVSRMRAKRECGSATRRSIAGVRSHGCPRNCERRAVAISH